jgi:predicted TIM-barrel fold metal-dependent hydrolase
MAILSRTGAVPLNLITSMLLSGVSERIPELRIYLAETNAGWMPEAFYMMDDSYRLFRDWYGAELPMLPSEYAKEFFYFGVVRDPVAFKMGDLVPVAHLMFGTDFPHSVTSYPETEKWLDVIFDGVPDAVRHQVLHDTPCGFFGLDPTAELTATPAP